MFQTYGLENCPLLPCEVKTGSKALSYHNYAIFDIETLQEEKNFKYMKLSKPLRPMPSKAIVGDNTCAVLPCDIYGTKIPLPACTVITW